MSEGEFDKKLAEVAEDLWAESYDPGPYGGGNCSLSAAAYESTIVQALRDLNLLSSVALEDNPRTAGILKELEQWP